MTRILIAALVVVLALAIHYVTLRRHGHPRPVLGVTRYLHLHLFVGVLGWLVAGVFVVSTLTHGLGVSFHHARVKPPLVAGYPYSASVGWALPPVNDQGESNACVAFSVDEALWAERRIRGEALPYTMPSPFYTYWWNTYGQNVGTSIDGEAQAAEVHGMVPYSAFPDFGPAPSWTLQQSARGYGGSYRYVFSGYSGWAGLNAVEAEIAARHPVVLLLRVNESFYNATGAVTDNSGAFIGNHAVLAYAYGGSAITIRNSWGTGWGNRGNITLTPSAFLDTVIAAAVVEPGPVTWPAAPPTPAPAPRPTPTPRPRPHAHPVYYRITHKTILRSAPRLGARTAIMLYPGQTVRYNGRSTPHFIAVCSTHCGWAWRPYVRR